jgi:F420-dependent oxidoreductase-like protein
VADAVNLPAPCLVILIGPGASGKSTWAAAHFRPEEVVSSDRLRAVAGAGEDDQTASTDAFQLLEQIVRMRVGRRLTTVVDTLGFDPERRRAWLALARERGLPCYAVVFDVSPAESRTRNERREKRIPASVLTSQLRTFRRVPEMLAAEGYDGVLEPVPARVVPPAFVEAADGAGRQREQPVGLRFGLHLAAFTFRGGTGATAERVREIAAEAEAAGFDAIYVMDHFRQIPQIGRAWEDFLESYTTLGYLAAATERVRVGALVTGITYRNVAHLGKIIATLDALSGGRAVCGLGLGWFKEEHRAYGWDLPPVRERYALLEDALQLLPRMWGPGGKPFHGRVLHVPDTSCYPRPLQNHVRVIVGGGGERRTLRLAAQYADAANVFGDPDTVRRKAAVLRSHCAVVGRDPSQVEMTHLSTALIGDDDSEVRTLVDRLRPRTMDAARYAASVHAGTVGDHIGRFRQLADAGSAEVMVRLADLTDTAPLQRMAKVIAAFR